MDIHDRIKLRRLELGLTLKDVSKRLGVAESTVSRYETEDIKNMGIDKIEKLANALDCSPGYIMGWEIDIDIEKLNKDNKKKLEDYFLLLLSSQK